MNPLLMFLHRWVGVVLALFMLAWFSTGLTIAFIGSPSISRVQQLAQAASLSPQDGWLSLGEALRAAAASRAKSGSKAERPVAGIGSNAREGRGEAAIVDARLARIDGTPVWLVEDDRGRRSAISALDGAAVVVSVETAERIARRWLGSVVSLAYLDTIDAPVGVRNTEALKPFHRFAVTDSGGTQVIVSSRSGEIVQVSTRVERALAYAGNWLHLFRWLDALGAGEYRRDALAYAGFFAAVGALTGLVLGWIRWKPGFFGRPTYARGRTQPYRERWLKYHFWAGLIGGSFALSWAASGFVSTNPGQIFSPANASREELLRYRGEALPAVASNWKPSAALALDADIVELGWSRVGDDALLLAYARDGSRRALSVPETSAAFSEPALLAAAQRLAGDKSIAAHELQGDYDNYYYPNHRQTAFDKPLPVLRVDFADAARTSLYIDPADGRLLAKFDTSRRAYRWLYSAVHHWDFGWFHNRRLWNAWMASWILLGLALSVSAVVLAFRRLRRSIPLQERESEPRVGQVTVQKARAVEGSL